MLNRKLQTVVTEVIVVSGKRHGNRSIDQYSISSRPEKIGDRSFDGHLASVLKILSQLQLRNGFIYFITIHHIRVVTTSLGLLLTFLVAPLLVAIGHTFLLRSSPEAISWDYVKPKLSKEIGLARSVLTSR
jgi:hypothetical protein